MILDAGTLVRAQKGIEVAAPVPPPVVSQTTALVVDDSITMRRVTQRLLERRGARVLTARDGLDAITVMQEHEIDIILLDIEMPRMDGYQFATHVRNDPKARHVPIIMITSRSGEKHRAKAIEIGVNDYLSKPYQESQLVAAIEVAARPGAPMSHDPKELYSLVDSAQARTLARSANVRGRSHCIRGRGARPSG